MKNEIKILYLLGLLTIIGSSMALGQPITPRGLDTGDGPFGINMAETPEKHGCSLQSELGDFIYLCEDVPKPHPDIDAYAVWSYPETGIAFIKAAGETNENDKYGNSIRADMDRIAKQIATKYGDWTHYDFIQPTGIWTEADEWTASIRQGERTYAYLWEFENHRQLKRIVLNANALTHDDTYFLIEFEFRNSDKFKEVRDNRGTNAF